LDRSRVVWALLYAYLAFLFVGEIPAFSGNPLFSIQLESILLVVLYLSSSYLGWGASKATKFLVGTWVTSYAIEFIGLNTGYPFGHYSYTSALSPFIGPVPMFIPFLWCSLGYFCLQAGGASIVVPASLLTFLDISFDPIFSRNLWHWGPTIGFEYAGVPILNFLGWFISAIVIFTIFRMVDAGSRKSPRRSILYSRGSIEGAGFYFLFGVSTVLSDLNANLPEVASVSAFLYLVSGALLAWFVTRKTRVPQSPTTAAVSSLVLPSPRSCDL
jgi:putative membrane protein